MDELKCAVAEFVGAFEEVFERDWEYSKTNLHPANLGFFVRPNATFLNPGVEDEDEDWGARAALLDKYRRLLHIMQRLGIEPKKPWLWQT